MNTVSILLRVIAIIGAGAAVAFWFLTQNKVAAKDADLKRAMDNQQTIEQQLNEKTEEVAQLESRVRSKESELADEKSKTTKLNSQLVQSRREINNIQDEVKRLKEETNELSRQNKTLKEEIINKEIQVPTDVADTEELEEEIESLKAQVGTLKGELRDAKAMASSSATNAEQEEANASSTTSGSRASGLSNLLGGSRNKGSGGSGTQLSVASTGKMATVLKIDHRQGFLILSLGADSGYAANSTLGIVKGTSRPLRLRITKTAPEFAVASVLPGEANAKLFTEGDVVEIFQ